MSVTPKPGATKPAPSVFGSDLAPTIYFDGIVAYGMNNGVVQLELAQNCLVPSENDKKVVRTRVLITAHLRGGPGAMAELAQAIFKAIELGKSDDVPKTDKKAA